MTANATLICCKLKRPGGTTVTMADGAVIKFVPDENGDHVAAVSNRDHINRRLSISEGYALHFEDMPAATPVLSAPPKAVVTQGAQPVVPATQPPVEPVIVPVPDNTSDLAALTDDEIKAVYRAEWNKEPHPKAKRETIIAQIEARREEAKA